MAAPPASAIPGRCPSRSPRRSTRAISWSPRCSRATAISRAASMPQVRANYLASPPLVVAYALAGSMTHRSRHATPLGDGQRRQAGLSARTSGRRNQEIADTRAQVASTRRHVPQALRQRVRRARRNGRRSRSPSGMTFSWDPGSTYLAHPPYFDNMPKEPAPLTDIERRARAGDPRRQHHHRPHLARRLDQEGRPGRRISDRAPGAAGGVQLLRRAARQSRGDDARHLRQYPHQERDGAGRRGRHDQASCPTAR